MTPENKEELAHILLIELLGYQFASPVRWIDTQDVLINDYNIEKLIEIGPQPILSNMMKKTVVEKQDQMFSIGKSEVSCYCVSDFNNIEYYETSKNMNDDKVVIKKDEKKENVEKNTETYNPFLKTFAGVDTYDHESSTFVDFVNIQTCNSINGDIRQEDIDIEKEKNILQDLALDMAPKTNLLNKFVHLANENKQLNEHLVSSDSQKLTPFFAEEKIRTYDNSYNWIKEDFFKIAVTPNFSDIEEFTQLRISNLLKNNKISKTILNQFDSILRYYNKSIESLMQFFVMNAKESECYYSEPRCDSNVTLFDVDDYRSSSVETFELLGESLIPIDIDLEKNSSTHCRNQCYMVIFDELDSEILDIVKEWLTYDNNVICCFNCDNVDDIYPLSLQLQDIYKKHSSFFATLRLLPISPKTDSEDVVKFIYNKLGYDISAIMNLAKNIDMNELSDLISTEKSKLPFITATTTILSEFSNLKNFINLIKNSQKNISHIQYETLNSGFKELSSFINIKQDLKLTLTNTFNDCVEDNDFKNNLLNNNILVTVSPLAEVSLPKPTYSTFEKLSTNFNGDLLRDSLSPENLVAITGFAELGPLGNASTRWDYEKNYSKFSMESIIQLSLIMGLIKYDTATSGFKDSKTNETINMKDVQNYEPYILKHTGVRIMDESVMGYDPNSKKMLQEVVIMQDFKIVVPEETMLQYKLENSENSVSIVPKYEDGNDESHNMFEITFKPGNKLYLPKALKFDRFVAGQIPTGWNPSYYGISDDIIEQVDRTTLFSLISTAEALITSGITDPYELYKYMHVSEVGNCSGSGVGGLKSQQKMQKTRFMDGNVQNDILQETFINVMSAWVNMLLLSSSGPIKTPVGACATALESLDLGYETIMSGKASMVLVGGCDDIVEETSYEFGAMGATSNSDKEIKAGRNPKEMCRPMTSSRNGFMESHGSGIQVLMRGDLAIKMGLPIFGVVGFTTMNADKISKSLPAPGKGVLTAAKKSTSKVYSSRKLDLKYRKRHIEKLDSNDAYTRKYWNVDFYKNDANISPIEGALSVFGLNANDITANTCHGTSTKANDKNESNIVNTIMKQCNRKPGNLLPIVAQKAITGHPKAAAGAWMINGALQIFKDSIIPGNFNADNVDGNLTKDNDYLLFNKENITGLETIKSIMVTSFGFGQKGALALIINPNYLLATLNENELNEYMNKFDHRYNKANSQYQHRILYNTIFQEKNSKPFESMADEDVYLDSELRL
ncbi:thiolase-like protein [Hanseniaspora valbyensis NRRL Y-1626]|uniref:beta-ketoacyl-[acyl-carrier-protein] synthase I n=1 Tax=Hanseniaspora valbyensis NRRL Y-1626 TaxID=766949 RepID=A0A1B7TE21_9ASCO|nr:thiolase-like protein [Hanseniaspora valbyensis NRRL Y-1626]